MTAVPLADPCVAAGTRSSSEPLAEVSSGGGRCVSEETLWLHVFIWGKKGKKKKMIIILVLLLHLPVCPSPCCTPRQQLLAVAHGFPRGLATARIASDW